MKHVFYPGLPSHPYYELAQQYFLIGRHGDARAAISYFRLPARGYYSYELGNWHIVSLNSERSMKFFARKIE